MAEWVLLKCRDLKNLPILYYWNDRAKNELSFIALWYRRSFSANSKGPCSLCLHNSTVWDWFVWAALPRFRAVAICPRGKDDTCITLLQAWKGKTTCEQWSLLAKRYYLISLNMCLKWSIGDIIIALSHLFNDLFVYARTADSRTHKCFRDVHL